MAGKIKRKFVNIEGVAEWAKIFKSNRDLEGYRGAWKDTDGRTSINIILEPTEFEKLKEAGSLKKGKNVDGGINVKLDRKWDTGRDWDGGEPEIYRADGSRWDLDEDGYIGNGSKVRLQVSVAYLPDQDTYSTVLEKVKVLDLIPYQKKDDFSSDESGGGSSPAPKSTKPTPHHNYHNDDLEDEIPF